MIAVVDSNVLVSAALFPKSVPGRSVDLAHRLGQVIYSQDTLSELDEVLRRPRFDRTTSLHTRMEFFANVILLGDEVEIAERITACRDPRDDKFLELAVNGRATHVITGDLDLLALHPFRGIAILTPADFVALFVPPAAA